MQSLLSTHFLFLLLVYIFIHHLLLPKFNHTMFINFALTITNLNNSAWNFLFHHSKYQNLKSHVPENEKGLRIRRYEHEPVSEGGAPECVVCLSKIEEGDEIKELRCEASNEEKFDILGWWKVNSSKYRVLSQVARDVLAIPVCTVASESTFSTGGRILDPFRSSLSPMMVEALICTQNWLQSIVPISLRKAMDDVEELEQYDPAGFDLFGFMGS
ncbi:unnamed protein product [Camellia sinensis]